MTKWFRYSFALPGAALALLSVQAGSTQQSFPTRVLSLHNAERSSLGMRDLQWDSALAEAASRYAAELAATGKWEHSAAETRPGQGENLWMGTRGAYSPEQMVGHWVEEKAHFKWGTFPHVSRTGSFEDVGHYTQIIWAETTRVGCAIRASADSEYLVCRYSTPGNVFGQAISSHTLASR
jgi:hypothetical protein